MNHVDDPDAQEDGSEQPIAYRIPPNDGGRYRAWKALPLDCDKCRRPNLWDQPQVMAYNPSLDPTGEQRWKHPGWATKGWLQIRQCSNCGKVHYQVVTEEYLTVIADQFGGWKP